MSIEVVIVDDHTLFRQGLRALLEVDGRFEVIGEADSASQSIDLAIKMRPRIILMDIAMRDMDGLTAARRILDIVPDAKIIFLTQYENKEYVLPAIRLGASGYILKRSAADVLVQAIQKVADGDFYLDTELSDVLVNAYKEIDGDNGFDALTEREREILILLAKDKTNKEIAAILGISVKTADYHRTNLMRKLGVHSKVELVKYSLKKGLVEC